MAEVLNKARHKMKLEDGGAKMPCIPKTKGSRAFVELGPKITNKSTGFFSRALCILWISKILIVLWRRTKGRRLPNVNVQR